jgi:hypothetical protein
MTLIGTAEIRFRLRTNNAEAKIAFQAYKTIIRSVSLGRRLTPLTHRYPIERGHRLLTVWIVRRSFPRQLDPLHVLMACKAAVAVIPFYGHVPRLGRGDRAKVGRIAIVANASSGFEFARVVGGH